MHPLRLLLDLLPLVLVEQRRIPRPRRAPPILPLARRLARRAQGREEGDVGQQHELVPVSHHTELFADVSERAESRQGHCGDQEDDGVELRHGNDEIYEKRSEMHGITRFIHSIADHLWKDDFTPVFLFFSFLAFHLM